MKTRTISIDLPYFKKGDDLQHHLENTSSLPEAFRQHAKMLSCAVEQLNTIANVLEKHSDQEIEVNADTHMIWIYCPEEVAEVLVKQELGSYDEWDEEECEECGECFEECVCEDGEDDDE
jgi:Pyruvate/2-oxoacid:ferredoxin oxidoreductase delta subunit